jgi:hypothetical protein
MSAPPPTVRLPRVVPVSVSGGLYNEFGSGWGLVRLLYNRLSVGMRLGPVDTLAPQLNRIMTRTFIAAIAIGLVLALAGAASAAAVPRPGEVAGARARPRGASFGPASGRR